MPHHPPSSQPLASPARRAMLAEEASIRRQLVPRTFSDSGRWQTGRPMAASARELIHTSTARARGRSSLHWPTRPPCRIDPKHRGPPRDEEVHGVSFPKLPCLHVRDARGVDGHRLYTPNYASKPRPVSSRLNTSGLRRSTTPQQRPRTPLIEGLHQVARRVCASAQDLVSGQAVDVPGLPSGLSARSTRRAPSPSHLTGLPWTGIQQRIRWKSWSVTVVLKTSLGSTPGRESSRKAGR